jgi:hypothetical protein
MNKSPAPVQSEASESCGNRIDSFLLCFNGEAAGLHSADISGTIITDGCLVLSTQRRSGDETRALPAHAGAAGLILIVITMGALWRHDPSWFFSPVEPRHTELSAARAEVWTLDTHLDGPSVALTDWLRNLWVLHTVVSYQ